MFAPLVLAVFNVLTFTVLPVTGALKVVLCLVFYIGAGMAYTAICITYGGLVNLIARDSQVRMSLLTYYVIYVVGSAAMIAPIFSSITALMFVGSLCLPWATKTFGKRNWLIILNTVQVASFVLLFLVPANNAAFLMGVSMIIGFTSSGANVCTGMLSDCIEYGDWKYGIREEGLTYSFMSFGVKLASALTGSIGVLLLAAVGDMWQEWTRPWPLRWGSMPS